MTTAGPFLAAARVLPFAGLAEITGGRALILAPHPDDESLGCGGLIAEACAQNQLPVIAMLTDGAGSHPNSRLYPAPRLRQTRRDETLAAVACLGLPPDNVSFLDYPDTRAPLDGPALHGAADRIAALLRRHGCRSIVASWEDDPHTDHLAAHRAAVLAAQACGVPHRAYPVWGLLLADDTAVTAAAPSGFRLDVSAHLPAKRRAIRCHASQQAGLITDDPDGFQLQPEFLALFDTPAELYFEAT